MGPAIYRKKAKLHTPSTTTLNAWFCQAFPFLGGSGVLLWLHSIPCLCPLAFASVSRHFKALFTTQHRRDQPVVYPATRRTIQRFIPVIEAYDMPVDIPVREVQKWPISAVSVKFHQAAA
jgi:hypothetical protein